MRSIKRNLNLITAMLSLFLIGMVILVYKIYSESSFYILNSDSAVLGKIYDRNGEVLFDQNASPETYGYDLFRCFSKDSDFAIFRFWNNSPESQPRL